MDYQRFIAQLPNLYENWGQDSVRPKSEQFQQVPIRNDNSKRDAVAQFCCGVHGIRWNLLWNWYLSRFNFNGALLNHPERMAYAVDNFSEFDTFGVNLDKLTDNLSNFGLQEQVYFTIKILKNFLCERELGRKKK